MDNTHIVKDVIAGQTMYLSGRRDGWTQKKSGARVMPEEEAVAIVQKRNVDEWNSGKARAVPVDQRVSPSAVTNAYERLRLWNESKSKMTEDDLAAICVLIIAHVENESIEDQKLYDVDAAAIRAMLKRTGAALDGRAFAADNRIAFVANNLATYTLLAVGIALVALGVLGIN